ncbi:MAG: hypothetical protein Q9183_004625, partial [Haloplaca sp. 2 TL-2023]
TAFYVHADVLAKSDVLAKEVRGSWKEHEERKIEWPEWSVDAADKFVEWLYTGDYRCPYPSKIPGSAPESALAAEDSQSPAGLSNDQDDNFSMDGQEPSASFSNVFWRESSPKDTFDASGWDTNSRSSAKKKRMKQSKTKSDTLASEFQWSRKRLSELTWSGSRDLAHITQAEDFDKWSGHQLWGPKELDYGATFMTHAQLYVMACFYMVPDLKNMAWQRLRSVLMTIGSPANNWRATENLKELIQYAYAKTESHDQEPLRTLVTMFTALHYPRIKGDVIDQLILSEEHSDREFHVDLTKQLTQQLGELRSLVGNL